MRIHQWYKAKRAVLEENFNSFGVEPTWRGFCARIAVVAAFVGFFIGLGVVGFVFLRFIVEVVIWMTWPFMLGILIGFVGTAFAVGSQKQ